MSQIKIGDRVRPISERSNTVWRVIEVRTKGISAELEATYLKPGEQSRVSFGAFAYYIFL